MYFEHITYCAEIHGSLFLLHPTMPHCCAWGCNNQSKLNKVVTYHFLPKDKHTASLWIRNINRTTLPKDVYLCSDHFEESCFDPHHDMKQRLLPEGSQSRIKRMLKKDAVPTKFPQNPTKTVRDTSEKRLMMKEQSEVTLFIFDCFLDFDPGSCSLSYQPCSQGFFSLDV